MLGCGRYLSLAAQMAADDAKTRNPVIIREFGLMRNQIEVHLEYSDTFGDASTAVRHLLEEKEQVAKYSAIAGPATDDVAVVVSNMMSPLELMMITGSARSVELTKVSHAYRTSPSEQQEARAIAKLAEYYSWPAIACVSLADTVVSSLCNQVTIEVNKLPETLTVRSHVKQWSTHRPPDINDELSQLRSLGVRVFFLITDMEIAKTFLEGARDNGMLENGWIWLADFSLTKQIIENDDDNDIFLGFLGITPRDLGSKYFKWKSLWESKWVQGAELPNLSVWNNPNFEQIRADGLKCLYITEWYDAMAAMALASDDLDISSTNQASRETTMYDAMSKMKPFEGASGPVSFDSNGDRVDAKIVLWNVQITTNGSTPQIVGHVSPEGDVMVQSPTIIWPGHLVGEDKTETPSGFFPLCTGGEYYSHSMQECRMCRYGYYPVPTDRPDRCYPCPMGQYRLEGMDKCELCLPGTASSKEAVKECSECSPGQYALPSGSLTCVPCPRGSFTDRYGASECQRCEMGTFQDRTGSRQCVECASTFITLGTGSDKIDDCICDAGFFLNRRSFICQVCTEGYVCPGGTQIPQIQPGYWAPNVEDEANFDGHDIYGCRNSQNCVGGDAGDICSTGSGISCALCRPNEHWNGSECEECEHTSGISNPVIWISIALPIGILVIFFIKQSSSRHDRVKTVFFTSVIARLISMIQTTMLFGMIETYFWPNWLLAIWEKAEGIALDVASLKIECFFSNESRDKKTLITWGLIHFYITITAPLICAVILLLWSIFFHFLRKMCKKIPKMPRDDIICTCGALLELYYIPIASEVISPFFVFNHPANSVDDSRLSGLASYPYILQGSDDWYRLLPGSVLGISLYMIAWPLFLLRIIMISPRRSLHGDESFKDRYEWLFIPYADDSYWFDLVILARKTCLALCLLLPTLSDQEFGFILCILLYLCFSLLRWPYRHDLVCWTDIIMCVGEICVLSAANTQRMTSLALAVTMTYFIGVMLLIFAILKYIIHYYNKSKKREKDQWTCWKMIKTPFVSATHRGEFDVPARHVWLSNRIINQAIIMSEKEPLWFSSVLNQLCAKDRRLLRRAWQLIEETRGTQGSLHNKLFPPMDRGVTKRRSNNWCLGSLASCYAGLRKLIGLENDLHDDIHRRWHHPKRMLLLRKASSITIDRLGESERQIFYENDEANKALDPPGEDYSSGSSDMDVPSERDDKLTSDQNVGSAVGLDDLWGKPSKPDFKPKVVQDDVVSISSDEEGVDEKYNNEIKNMWT
eukprot:GHVL01039083.1.p1 GENE.GHVL01039083.1~~GHVL01039083.1.p1  ORF type:complete len:1270 (-),score=165.22 GHVL01039083.1:63-3872(-)